MRWLIAVVVGLLLCVPVAAQFNNFPPGTFASHAANDPAPASYTGPGDINTTNFAWWGLRAYTSALANAGATTTPVMDVYGVTTTTSCTIYLLGDGTGGLDFSTAGAGAVGHQCLLGATTFCTSTNSSCTVSKLYDQSGATKCGGATVACDLSQATQANQPTLTFNCIGSLPCLTFSTTSMALSSATANLTISQPFTISWVVERTGNFSSFSSPFGNQASQVFFGWNNTSGSVRFNAGSSINVTSIADSAFHAMNALASGSSSAYYIDGTSHSGSAGSNGLSGGQILCWGCGAGNGTPLQAVEGGFWTTDKSANFSTLNANQHAYWGF